MDLNRDRIERLKRALYSRNEDMIPKEKHTSISEHEVDVPTDWGVPKSFEFSPDTMISKNNSFFNKFLVGSLIFFTISLAVAFFIFFGGLNMISPNNLDISIVAPSSISSGEELDMGLTILNSNRADLEEVALFIDYPEGSRTVSQDNKVISYEKINLNTIPKGSTADYTIRTLLFGEKDSIKTFILRLEYKIKGSNAVFSKEKTYDVSIGSSPVLLNVEYPKEVNSGQEIKISIEVTSNSSVVIKDSLIKIDYPYGFTYKSSNIKPIRDDSIWNIGDLRNGDKKTLVVTGILVGQNMEDRSFRISAGTKSAGSSIDFEVPLAESSATIGIRKSFFNLEVAPTGGLVYKIGQPIQTSIRWQNTLPDKIINSRIEVKLSGNVFDRLSVKVGNQGFYRSIDDTVLWDKNALSSLIEMIPGENGQVTLGVSSITDPILVRSIKNPHVDMHVVMSGDRSGTDLEPVSSTVDVVVKILSTMNLSAKVYRATGPFSNTGPIPPRADKESTYTVTLTMTNTTNDLSGAMVTAVLPAGVDWKGEVSPVSEKITYNPDTRVISWNVGNVSSGTGFTYSPKEVSFKVAIIPSVSQISSTPTLVSDVEAIAVDTYTGTQISQSNSNIRINTEFSDANYKTTDGIVIK